VCFFGERRLVHPVSILVLTFAKITIIGRANLAGLYCRPVIGYAIRARLRNL
jgi:hypothetical protein